MSGIVDADFERIAAVLGIGPDTAGYGVAYAFWQRLRAAALADATDIGIEFRAEEALVWRMLTWRALTELGPAPLFERRAKGGAGGTSAAHPALEALGRLYERLCRSISQVEDRDGERRDERSQGLPDLMKPILEETEVAFDELLGPGGLPGRPSTNGLSRREDSHQ